MDNSKKNINITYMLLCTCVYYHRLYIRVPIPLLYFGIIEIIFMYEFFSINFYVLIMIR